MATRGPKHKPAHLKVVTGNPGKRPIVDDPAQSVADDFDNGLEPPKKLTKRQQDLWDSYIRRAEWLTAFDVPRAFMWVALQTEFERSPKGMVASRIAQLRALGSELGLEPSSRQRLGVKTQSGPKQKDPAAKYFD